MKRLLRSIGRTFRQSDADRVDLPRVIPPVWASDDDLALLRKAGLL